MFRFPTDNQYYLSFFSRFPPFYVNISCLLQPCFFLLIPSSSHPLSPDLPPRGVDFPDAMASFSYFVSTLMACRPPLFSYPFYPFKQFVDPFFVPVFVLLARGAVSFFFLPLSAFPPSSLVQHFFARPWPLPLLENIPLFLSPPRVVRCCYLFVFVVSGPSFVAVGCRFPG